MPGFYLTPEQKARRRRLRLEKTLIQLKSRFLGGLSEAEQRRLKDITRELAKHY